MFIILSIASSIFSLSPKAVSLKYPSPLGPKPTPGVPTTPVLFSNLSKNYHDFISFGTLSQIYGAFIPPYTLKPAVFNPSVMTFAFSL